MRGSSGGTLKTRIMFWVLENVELLTEDLLDCATYSYLGRYVADLSVS